MQWISEIWFSIWHKCYKLTLPNYGTIYIAYPKFNTHHAHLDVQPEGMDRICLGTLPADQFREILTDLKDLPDNIALRNYILDTAVK